MGKSSSLAACSGRNTRVRAFQTQAYAKTKKQAEEKPGAKAFAECETDAIRDLFHVFAKTDGDEGIKYLDHAGVRELLQSIGERPDEKTLKRLFKAADFNGDGVIELHVSTAVYCLSIQRNESRGAMELLLIFRHFTFSFKQSRRSFLLAPITFLVMHQLGLFLWLVGQDQERDSCAVDSRWNAMSFISVVGTYSATRCRETHHWDESALQLWREENSCQVPSLSP